MKILALEFSSSQRSAAVVEGGAGGPPALLGTALQTGSEKIRPLALVEEALRAARLEREHIDALAVGLGPGSYTGIRMAISLAQGWQLARAVRLLGVGSVEALAAQAQDISGPVSLVIDAQRNEFYLAVYELGGPVPRVVEALRLATQAEMEQRAAAGELILGPDLQRRLPSARVLFPDAATVGALAAARTNFVPGEQLEPIYLRETTFVKAPPPRLVP